MGALMMRTQWNDAEDKAMDYLPHADQIVYLRGIRRRMDFETGMAGMNPAYPISYSWLSQLCEVRPDPCSTLKPPPRLVKDQLRSIFKRLERAGLIERVTDHGLRSLVFRCLLADRDQSARNMSHPSATHEPPITKHPKVLSSGAGSECMSHPPTTPRGQNLSHPIPDTGIPDKSEAKASPCRTRSASRFSEFWDAWPTGQRKRDRHKAEQAWKRHNLDAKADEIIDDVKRRAVADQQWLRGYTPMPTTYINGRRWEDELGAPMPSGQGQRASLHDRNRAALDAWLGDDDRDDSATVIEGDFRYERS